MCSVLGWALNFCSHTVRALHLSIGLDLSRVCWAGPLISVHKLGWALNFCSQAGGPVDTIMPTANEVKLAARIDSEHLLRQASKHRGILDLGMQRIDVRCAALESISTQATLVAGFAFGSLAPDVLDTLRGDADFGETYVDICFSIAFIACTAASFGASIWVIYMALYVGYKAQFTALQGRSADAVQMSLKVLLRTNERISYFFNVALVFLAVAATLMAWSHLHVLATIVLLAVFGYFIRDGYTFQTALDASFASIERGEEPAASVTAQVAARPHGHGSSRPAISLPEIAARGVRRSLTLHQSAVSPQRGGTGAGCGGGGGDDDDDDDDEKTDPAADLMQLPMTSYRPLSEDEVGGPGGCPCPCMAHA